MLPVGTVSLPGRPVAPLTAVTRRMLLAVLLPVASTVIAVVRGNEVLASDDPRATPLARGDRLILMSSPQPPASQH
jgi:hypothetical protein